MEIIKVEQSVSNHLVLCSLIALLLGVLFQPFAVVMNGFLAPLIMIMIYLSAMSIDYSLVIDEIRTWWHGQIYLAVMGLIILPAAAYYGLLFLSEKINFIQDSFVIGSLLIHSVGVAASVPGLVYAMQGKFERAGVCLLLTSFLMIITQPFMLHYVGHVHVVMQPIQMIYSLCVILLPPIILGGLTKQFCGKTVAVIAPHIKVVFVLLFMMLMIGCMMGVDKIFLEHFVDFVFPAVCVSVVTTILFLLAGWFLSFDHDLKARLTASLLFAFPNVGLVVAVVPQWFPGNIQVIGFVVINTIVIIMVPAFAKLVLAPIVNKRR